MTLDVYVGSLSRYYSDEWENLSERAAHKHGAPYRIANADGASDKVQDAGRIQAAILAWRAMLTDSLGSRITIPLDWEEVSETPYFTARPGWDGFGSLVLWAAYAEHPAVRRPASLPEEWDNDAILLHSNAAEFRSRYSHLVRNVELWLPGPFDFTFEAEDVDGRRVVVGSVAMLRRQLDELNAATWKATPATIAEWARQPPVDNAPLEQSARYAFAVLIDLVGLSVGHRLPMKLDY
jgi:hypothetical protein